MLELIHMPEGRILKNGGSYSYEYVLRDHLGNARSGFSGSAVGTATIGMDYYPFGLQYRAKMGPGSPKNNYLYNGKELQDKLKLYDYGARFYDPVIGRWGTIDPKSELYFQISPYAYAANTPVNAIDPDGKLVIFINGNHYGEGGSRRYWQSGWVRNRSRVGIDESEWVATRDFAGEVMRHLGDYHAMYVDGAGNAMKGYHPFSTLLSPGLSGVGAKDRTAAGYSEGKANAAAIIESLERTGGAISESIKVITHSMGVLMEKVTFRQYWTMQEKTI